MATTSGTTVFVLGKEADGNREIRVLLDGESYDMDAGTITAYSSGTTAFPYSA